MTKYNVKTTFPVNEESKSNKTKLTKQTDIATDLESNEVLRLYSQYLQAGYKVNFGFDTADDEGSVQDFDPFDVAENLTKNGIDYKANLKLKAKGAYSDLKDVMHLIEAEGYNMTVNVKLKINDKTSLNVDNTDSWTDEDAVFSITPSISVNNILEIKDLYENLTNRGFETNIVIKPKTPKGDDNDPEASFETILSQYPDNTTVKFMLSDSEAF